MTATHAMLPQPARIDRVKRETRDTFTLTVRSGDGTALSPFQPGQFSMVYAFGVAELPLSISSDPADAGELRYTVRSVGEGTHRLVRHRAGDWIGVRGPFGAGWPLQQARGKDVVLVAGGIGLAPLRPVIYSILRRRGEFGRLILLYGARRPGDLLYRAELARWRREPHTRILTTVDYGGVEWRGHVGVVTQLFRRVRLAPERTIAMTCGPEIMMRYAAAGLEDLGVARERIFLSMERNMKCGIGWCGHCQHGPRFVCKDGPVFAYSELADWMGKHEV